MFKTGGRTDPGRTAFWANGFGGEKFLGERHSGRTGSGRKFLGERTDIPANRGRKNNNSMKSQWLTFSSLFVFY